MKSFVTILMIMGASLAYPADEEPRQPAQLPEQAPQNLAQPGFESAQSDLEQPQPGLAPGEQNADESDLKTDATFWWGNWGRSYYPPYYRRSYSGYYRPRSRYVPNIHCKLIVQHITHLTEQLLIILTFTFQFQAIKGA